MLMLASANVAQIWPRWLAGSPGIRTCAAPITAAACSQDGHFLALGCQDGSYQLHSPQQAGTAPILSGRFEAPAVAAWFSSNAAAIFVTRDGRIHRIEPPARILICRGRTHKLLDEGWGGGARGTERGLARALLGTAISDEGHRIAAVDFGHNLWLFKFDATIPDVPPQGLQGHILLTGVVACDISASGCLSVDSSR